MEIKKLEKIFEENKDEQQALKMEAYLRNQFKMLGIPKSKRAGLEKEFIKETKKLNNDELITLVNELHNKDYREYMYTAQQILLANFKKLTIEDIYKITNLALINPWWENADGYVMVIKRWLKQNPGYIKEYVNKYYNNKNFWLRRISIIAQLSLKEKTDFEVLKKAIKYNIKDKEFFIQKAIGWSLRDYSKSNPKEVRNFIEENKDKLSNLAIKEGSKYI